MQKERVCTQRTSLIMTLTPLSAASCSAVATDCSHTLYVACTQLKRPSGARRSASRSVSACAVPESVRPMRQPRSARTRSSASMTSPSRKPLSSVAECTW